MTDYRLKAPQFSNLWKLKLKNKSTFWAYLNVSSNLSNETRSKAVIFLNKTVKPSHAIHLCVISVFLKLIYLYINTESMAVLFSASMVVCQQLDKLAKTLSRSRKRLSFLNVIIIVRMSFPSLGIFF